MTEPPAIRHSREHLSDVDIAKILVLDKESTSQREIASLVKCSYAGVQRVLTTYKFEMFQGHNPQWDYQRKTIQREDRYIEHALKQYDSIPLHDITNIVQECGLPVSETTNLAR